MSTILSRIISSETTLLDLAVEDKAGLFIEVGRVFESCSDVSSKAITDSLMARETLASTGLGHGVAVPHGRIEGLKSPMAAFVRLARPMAFGAPDDQPVQLIIVLLIPDNVTQKHLEILSEIAEMFSDNSFREALVQEKSAESVYKMLVSWLPLHQKKAEKTEP